ncbi:hypothetical protein ACFL6I_10130 [candidate division KSB1 bacterium]
MKHIDPSSLSLREGHPRVVPRVTHRKDWQGVFVLFATIFLSMLIAAFIGS